MEGLSIQEGWFSVSHWFQYFLQLLSCPLQSKLQKSILKQRFMAILMSLPHLESTIVSSLNYLYNEFFLYLICWCSQLISSSNVCKFSGLIKKNTQPFSHKKWRLSSKHNRLKFLWLKLIVLAIKSGKHMELPIKEVDKLLWKILLKPWTKPKCCKLGWYLYKLLSFKTSFNENILRLC